MDVIPRLDEKAHTACPATSSEARVALMSRAFLALILGLGFTALICLAINIPVAGLLIFALLAPGAIPWSSFAETANGDSIPLLFGTNVLFYSMLAYALIFFRFRNVLDKRLNSISLRLILPTAVLFALACIPRLNPLLPVGMVELSARESDLQRALPVGSNLTDARYVFKSRGIEFSDSVESADRIVFQGVDEKITASAGDRVLTSSLPTSASQYPCGYRLDILLVFGPDDIMKERYIKRFPLCP